MITRRQGRQFIFYSAKCKPLIFVFWEVTVAYLNSIKFIHSMLRLIHNSQKKETPCAMHDGPHWQVTYASLPVLPSTDTQQPFKVLATSKNVCQHQHLVLLPIALYNAKSIEEPTMIVIMAMTWSLNRSIGNMFHLKQGASCCHTVQNQVGRFGGSSSHCSTIDGWEANFSSIFQLIFVFVDSLLLVKIIAVWSKTSNSAVGSYLPSFMVVYVSSTSFSVCFYSAFVGTGRTIMGHTWQHLSVPRFTINMKKGHWW
jgi:hypothetical protein